MSVLAGNLNDQSSSLDSLSHTHKCSTRPAEIKIQNRLLLSKIAYFSLQDLLLYSLLIIEFAFESSWPVPAAGSKGEIRVSHPPGRAGYTSSSQGCVTIRVATSYNRKQNYQYLHRIFLSVIRNTSRDQCFKKNVYVISLRILKR